MTGVSLKQTSTQYLIPNRLPGYITGGTQIFNQYYNGTPVYTNYGIDTGNITDDRIVTEKWASITSVNYATNNTSWYTVPQQSRKEIKRFQLKSKLIISVKSRAQLVSGVSAAEQVAIQTLRDMISESDFRKYIKYGFLMVRGSSGDMFQVFRENWKTKVYRGGELIEEVCVRIKDSNVPPTDNVIAFKTIIESDDEAFRAMGNRFKVQRSGNITIGNIYAIAA